MAFPTADSYIFTVKANDGVRVYVDNVLIINEWRLGPYRSVFGTKSLTAGPHFVRVDYFDCSHRMHLSIDWKVGYLGWEARYYNSVTLDGQVIYKGDDINADPNVPLDMSWDGNNPPAPGVNPQNFSVDWERWVPFNCNCTYHFSATFDDGMRVYIDGRLLFDKLGARGDSVSIDCFIHPGRHFVEVQFIQRTGAARAMLTWTPAPTIAPTANPAGIIPKSCPGSCSHVDP
jgi:hypothetical protein